jgi:Mg-chelatase subunit ChlD
VVPTSYIELVVTPDSAVNPERVEVTANYGFDSMGGGEPTTNHIATTFVNLKAVAPGVICDNPADIVLVVDASGSMNWAWQTMTRWQKMLEVAHTFVDTTGIGYNRGALISFSNTASVRQALTYDITSLHGAINSLSTASTTNYLPALQAANAQLVGSLRKVVVFVSDGENTDPSAPTAALATAMKAAGAVIYTISINPTNDPFSLLASMAGPAGSGTYVSADQESELTGAMSSIAARLDCDAP